MNLGFNTIPLMCIVKIYSSYRMKCDMSFFHVEDDVFRHARKLSRTKR